MLSIMMMEIKNMNNITLATQESRRRRNGELPGSHAETRVERRRTATVIAATFTEAISPTLRFSEFPSTSREREI